MTIAGMGMFFCIPAIVYGQQAPLSAPSVPTANSIHHIHVVMLADQKFDFTWLWCVDENPTSVYTDLAQMNWWIEKIPDGDKIEIERPSYPTKRWYENNVPQIAALTRICEARHITVNVVDWTDRLDQLAWCAQENAKGGLGFGSTKVLAADEFLQAVIEGRISDGTLERDVFKGMLLHSEPFTVTVPRDPSARAYLMRLLRSHHIKVKVTPPLSAAGVKPNSR